MLNIFPTMFLALLAHALLRIVVGGALLFLGIQHLRKHGAVRALMEPRFPALANFFAWYIAVIEVILGLAFIVGFLTQIAALLAMLMALKLLYLRKTFTSPTFPSSLFYVLLVGASLSLFITGAGALAVDLPF